MEYLSSSSCGGNGGRGSKSMTVRYSHSNSASHFWVRDLAKSDSDSAT